MNNPSLARLQFFQQASQNMICRFRCLPDSQQTLLTKAVRL